MNYNKSFCLLLILFFATPADSQDKKYVVMQVYMVDEDGKRTEELGTNFKSDTYNVVHLYKNFSEEHKYCEYDPNDNSNAHPYTQEINRIAKDYSTDNECPELARISKEYHRIHTETDKDVEDRNKHIIKNVKREAEEVEIQVESSLLAWGYALSLSSNISKKLNDRLNYLVGLHKLVYKTPPTKVVKNGETIKDCSNVVAHGSDDLEEFYIDISEAPNPTVRFSYNTYTVPDNISLYSGTGELLHESKCIGTSVNVINNIKINTEKYKKVKVTVDALCDSEEGTTGWQLHFSCGEKKPSGLPPAEIKRRKMCAIKTKTMIKHIESNVNITLLSQERLWKRAICQKENYYKVVPVYTSGFTSFKDFKALNNKYKSLNYNIEVDYKLTENKIDMNIDMNNAFYNTASKKIKLGTQTSNKRREKIAPEKSNDEIVYKRIKAKTKFQKDFKRSEGLNDNQKEIYDLLGTEVPEGEDRVVASMPPVIKHFITPFVYGYDDFINKKHVYCPNVPNKETDLFKRISHAYCTLAYPRLFGIEDEMIE